MTFELPLSRNDDQQARVRLADWVELNLGFAAEQRISISDIAATLADIPPDEADAAEIWEDTDDEQNGIWVGAYETAEAAFNEIKYRAQLMQKRYPIIIEGEVCLLNTDSSNLLIFEFLTLLRARHLYGSIFNRDGEEPGLLFEEFFTEALGICIGASPDTRIRFGVAGNKRGGGLPTQLNEAIGDLSGRMFETRGTVPSSGQGDYRADVVAWKPFFDRYPGQLIAIGQATISEGEWYRGKREPSKKWTDRGTPDRRLIRFLARPVTAVAFVETISCLPDEILRGLTSSFSSIPFDRLRLLTLIEDKQLSTTLRSAISTWITSTKEDIPT